MARHERRRPRKSVEATKPHPTSVSGCEPQKRSEPPRSFRDAGRKMWSLMMLIGQESNIIQMLCHWFHKKCGTLDALLWGEIVEADHKTSNRTNLKFGRVLIQPSYYHRIQTKMGFYQYAGWSIQEENSQEKSRLCITKMQPNELEFWSSL